MRNKLSRLTTHHPNPAFTSPFPGWLLSWPGESITLDSVDFLYCLVPFVAPAHDLKTYAAVPRYITICYSFPARAMRYDNPLTPRLSYFQSKRLQTPPHLIMWEPCWLITQTFLAGQPTRASKHTRMNIPFLKKNPTPPRYPTTLGELLVDCLYTPTKPVSINKTRSDISKELLQVQFKVVYNHIPNILHNPKHQLALPPNLFWRS